MRYAYYPGCLAKSSAPELYVSTKKMSQRLGIELTELSAASCCGAGVQNEGNSFLNTVLNCRTFAMAEQLGLDILTICSTCQGVMCQVNKRLEEDPVLLSKTNEILDKIHLEYKGGIRIKHLLWALTEDYGLKRLEDRVVKPLTGLKIAPFYGCYILRPPEALQFDDPDNPMSLENVITTLGAEAVRFEGETKCCGFPLLFVQRKTALKMAAHYLVSAKQANVDFLVTPCPLCHSSLDTYQSKAEKQIHMKIGLLVVHLSQLIGLAIGVEPRRLGLSKHMVSMSMVLHGW